MTLSRYVSAAALTWILYDHFLTFEREREWIWSNKVTLTKVLFLIIRYTSPFVIFAEIVQFSGRVTLSDRTCVSWLFFEALWQSLTALMAQFLLGLRVCAIWGSRPWTKAVLYIGCLLCAGASLTSITVSLAEVASAYRFNPHFRVCYTMQPLPSWLWAAFFLPIMLFDILIFVLTIWNAFVVRFENIRTGSLTFMMWRDGGIYFVLIFFTALACVIVSATIGISKVMIVKFGVWAVQNVIISRVTLNLVEAVRYPDVEVLATTYQNPSVRDLSGRPSMSTNRRSRRSLGAVSAIDFAAMPSPNLTPTRAAFPSYPTRHSRTNLPYHNWTQSQGTESGKSVYVDQGWRDRQPGWATLTRQSDAVNTEVYDSGYDEYTPTVAGPSRRTKLTPPEEYEMEEFDGSVMAVGTGKSRLLTTSDARPSILKTDDVLSLRPIMPASEALDSFAGFGRNRADHLFGTPNSSHVVLDIRRQSVDSIPVVVEDETTERRKRMDQLIDALTTPPPQTITLS